MLRRLLAPSMLLALCTCISRMTGTQGNLEFSYATDDDPFDFNKPIGVGAKLKLKVAAAGTHGKVTLKKATSGSAALEVVSFSDDVLILLGADAGSAILTVEATDQGKTVEDEVTMSARVPEVLVLAHTCVTGRDARYFVSQNILMPFDMSLKNGRPVIGYGLYPVSVSSDAGLALDTASEDQTFLHFRTGLAPEAVTISSTIDTTTATATLVRAGDVTSGEHFFAPTAPVPTLVNTTGFYHVVPTVGGQRVCQPDILTTVATSTASVCTVAMADPPATEKKGRFGWVAVTGKVLGNCDFVVTYPQGNADAGATFSMRVPIAQFVLPDGGATGNDGGQSDGGQSDGGADGG